MNTQDLNTLRDGYSNLYLALVKSAGKKGRDQVSGHERVRLAGCCEQGLCECNKMIQEKKQ